ncbi:hypothetical protein OOK39_21930 [Streptomyces sp. NBC_00264]|uniref:hypothetical protein n=1 Tax=unclassified Streptomyces TaxID=2593676 RepID=UPI0022516C07|nr:MULTISPECIES: hypothetical protein [unclassified Streptomyces]MCX5161905.1 hypothetical protein [Streptomyces sp. NBC_00305]MCX5220422.1 hypothetical protein [Streptomyces sp. NBC_00264]
MTITLEQAGRILDSPPPQQVPGQLAVPVSAVPAAPAGLAQQFSRRTRALEGGHREWTGTTRATSGAGRFRHQGRDYTSYQAAFILRTGRAPVGNVRPTCTHPNCCDPAHVDDQAARQHNRANLAAVKGMQHRAPACDHDQSEHGRHRSDGRRYCNACNNPRAPRPCEHGNPACENPDTRPYVCGPRCEEHQPANTRPYFQPAK